MIEHDDIDEALQEYFAHQIDRLSVRSSPYVSGVSVSGRRRSLGAWITRATVAAATTALLAMPLTSETNRSPSVRVFTAVHEHAEPSAAIITGVGEANRFLSDYFSGVSR